MTWNKGLTCVNKKDGALYTKKVVYGWHRKRGVRKVTMSGADCADANFLPASHNKQYIRADS